MDGGAWQATVHGVAKSRTGLSDFTFTFLLFLFSSGCGYIVNEASSTCTTCNKDSSGFKSVFLSFDMLIDLTDHTGTLHSCSLTGSVAEETLGCTVNNKNT